MTRSTSQLEKLFAVAQPVCFAAGYELVDVRLVMEPVGWVLRVFIDHLVQGPGVLAVSLADCERISRELGVVLDVEDPIPQAYSLEVSSPGIDRPLRTAAHFRRFLGDTARVTLSRGLPVPGGENRRNYKGTIVAVDPPEAGAEAAEVAAFVVIDVDGTPHRLPIDDVETARLVPDWDAVLGTHAKPGKARNPDKKQPAARPAAKQQATKG